MKKAKKCSSITLKLQARTESFIIISSSKTAFERMNRNLNTIKPKVYEIGESMEKIKAAYDVKIEPINRIIQEIKNWIRIHSNPHKFLQSRFANVDLKC